MSRLVLLALAALLATSAFAVAINLDHIDSDVPVSAEESRALRLIQFGPESNQTAWLLPSTIDRLAVRGVRFFDITDHKDDFRRSVGAAPARFSYPDRLSQQTFVRRTFSAVTGGAIIDTIEWMSSFFNRYYTTENGERVVLELAERYRQAAGSRLGSDVSVEIVPHSWRQPSLIVTIQGTSRPNEPVILGGHIDSIAGSGANSRAPGADDDASGSSCVLQVFRALMQFGYRPDRTLQFHAYAAEEIGLRGSQAIAESFQRSGKPVFAMLNLDLAGFNRLGSSGSLGLWTDFVNPDLTKFLKLVLTEYSALPWEETKCGYGCSDHASWDKLGYPACYFGEGKQEHISPYIHSDRDTVDRIDPVRAQEIARASLGFMVELGTA